MSERHNATGEAEQEIIFDLMRERLLALFGPGGSFRITLGRATAGDALFVSTVADTIAHDVAAAFSPVRETAGRRAAPSTIAEHEALWKQIESELLIRRTGADSIDVDVDREAAAGRATVTHRAA